MKKLNLRNLSLVIMGLALSFSAASCKKSVNGPDTVVDSGVHVVDPKLVGTWMWTESSDGAYYDNNGVYNGSAYGLALQYKINADGTGTCFNHIYSSIGAGTGFEVNISYKGFFESDNSGHLGFFPLSGTYKNSNGVNRPLNADELWNINTKSGRNFLYQMVVVTTQGGRPCFQVTSSNGAVDTFFKQ